MVRLLMSKATNKWSGQAYTVYISALPSFYTISCKEVKVAKISQNLVPQNAVQNGNSSSEKL